MEGNYVSVIAPRVLLLQALSEKVEKLQSEIGKQKWVSFCSGLVAALEATRDEVLRGLPDDSSELKKVVKHVFEKEYNVVMLWEKVREHCAKTKDSSSAGAAVEVEAALALFREAIDKHVLKFLYLNPYEGSLLVLVSGSDLPRRASGTSTWAKFLEDYEVDTQKQQQQQQLVMPAPQQLSFLVTGLVLTQSLITSFTRATATTSDDVTTTDLVYYVTDRSDPMPFPSEARISRPKGGGSLEDLSYGVVKVGIVNGTTMPTPIEDVVYIPPTEFMQNDYTSFIQSLNAHLALLDEEAGHSSLTADVLIFIHGAWTNFGEGDIRRGAQIKHDMNLFGTVIAYCWTSHQTILGYLEDEKAVAATIPYLASFLKLCITQVKARRLHVLAHSIGNRAMIGALQQIYAEWDGEWTRTGLPLKNVISAAADCALSEFQGMVEDAKKLFGEENPTSEHRPHFSVYSSTDDAPLWVSVAVHNLVLRLGLTDAHFQDDAVTLLEPQETGFIDVIDATGYVNSIHMYFATEAHVLLDMQQLTSIPGKERAYLRANSNDSYISNVTYSPAKDKEFKFYSFSPESWDT